MAKITVYLYVFYVKKSITLFSGLALSLSFTLVAAPAFADIGSCYKNVTCFGMTRTPHYSKGAGGAIYKTEILCKGTGQKTVQVRVKGLLSFTPNTKTTPKQRASSVQTQTVSVNGKSRIFYTPLVGKHGGVGNGYWLRTSTWQIVDGSKYGTFGSETITQRLNIKKS